MIGAGHVLKALLGIARRVDARLADVGDAHTYDFRGSKAETKARVTDYLTEARAAALDAAVDLFNAAGFDAADVLRIQHAFRQDVTA